MIGDKKSFKIVIDNLKEAVDRAYVEFQKFNKAVESLQNTCDHEWSYDGHGHKDNYYTCEICGAKKTE